VKPDLTTKRVRGLLLALAVVLLPSCATLDPDYERPTVTLSSFRALPSEGMVPAFEIGLRIINPNRQALALEGVVYTIAVEGHELVKGVGRDFPVIEGYSEGKITLTASANLLAGIRFIGDMMQSTGESLDYEFEAKLDTGGIWPSLRVSETGTFDLAASPR
jgi:hypothetical protein